MSNDQNKAGINPISNKQLGTAPVPLIMPPTRRSTNAVAGKSAKSAKAAQQHDQQQQLPEEDQPLYDMAIVPEEGAAERALASAEAAMSVRRGEDDEEEATLEKSSHAEGDTAPILLAQASSTSKAADAHDSPASVGEELLRQAAPLPSTPPKAGPDGSESWLGKDWKLPVAIGGGALALLGLAAGGGGSSANGSGISATPSATPPSSGNDGAPPPPSNTWNLTVTPAAGPFLAGASVRASAQKWVGGAWQEIASTATVDRNGRMSFKIDKSMVTAQDILRVVVSDTGDSADHRDEIIGNQTLGATPLIAVIGGLDADQQVTANPLTTLAAMQIGQNLSPDNMNAIHAAVAKAFGISVGDLVHVLPVFLGGGGNPVETDDGKNYGLALGVVAGMMQAQRAAGVPSNDALDKALKVLAGAFVTGADGKLVLDLQKVRSVEVDKGDGTKAQVGLDEGAARLYQATGDAEAGANGAQVPYISIDPREVSAAVQQAKGADVNISYASFTDGLTLKINTAASVKVGDNLHIEFVRLNADGKPIADAKAFTYDYVLTKNDKDAIDRSNPSDKGGQSFLLTIPTHLDDAAKYNLENGARPAIPSSTDSSNFLLPIEAGKGANTGSFFYKPNGGMAMFQLRATGSALGFASAGARIALFSDQIAIEAAPVTSDGITFNGAEDGKTTPSNTIKVVMTLPYKISWSEGAAPTLDVMVGSKLLKASYTGGTGDVLHFALTLSSAANSESKELNNAVISIPDNALHIGNNNGNKVSIYTDTGNTLFKSDDGGKNWTKRDNTPLSDGANLAKILGVTTTQLDTPYRADTTPPADPILELVAPPIFNADGFRDADQVPKAGEVNARAFIQGSSANVAYALVTNRITQEFKVKFEPGKFIAGDAGAIVKLYAYKVTAPINTLMAETKLGATGEATFKTSDYNVTSFRTLVNGLSTQAEGVELKFYVEVVDAAGNVSKKGELKSLGTLPGSGNSIWIDTVAPDAPTDLKLDSTSDTGRNGVAADSASRNDGITSSSKPTLVLKGGTAGALAQIWSDAEHTQLLGQGVVQVVAGQVTSNGASIVLDKAAIKSGVNTVYATITDQAGNVSRTDKSFSFTYLPAFNGELLLDITSAQPTRGFYRKGDVIEVTVQFDRDVFLKNAQSNAQSTSQLRVILDSDNNKSINATYFIGLGTKTLKFRYTVEQDIERGSAGIFKATSLVSSGSSVLEDIAGNSIVIDPSKVKAVNGQEIKIDTVNPSVPILELPADIVATENTFSRANALGKGINLTAEDGSTVTLTFTKAGSNEVAVTKSVLVTGAGAQAVTLSVDELNKLGQGEISVKAQAVDPAGNMSVVSTGLTFKLDTQAPKATAKVVSPQGVGLTNGTVVFEVSFDEPLKRALTETDDNFFEVKNGTISKLQRIDDTRYRISVIPTPKVVSSDVTLELKSGMASPLSDKAGNLVETGVTLARQAIDTQGPTVTATPDVQGPVMGGRDVSFTVVLSEPISVDYGVIGKGNFTATNGIVTSVTPIEGFGGLRYKVTVKPNAPLAVDGDIVLGLIATPSGNGALLRDALGNQTDNVPTLATQKIDVSPPKVVADDVSVTPSPTGSLPFKAGYYHVGDTLTVKVKFSEVMQITGKPTVDIDLGGGVMRSAVFSALSEDKLTASFVYVITAGDNAAKIIVPARGIKLAGGSTITDLAGNPADLTSQDKPTDSGIKIDTAAPVIVEAKIDSADVSVANGLYKAGAILKVAVRFNEEIDITLANGSKPTLTLMVGGVARTASYKEIATDGKTLLFTYEVVPGDNDAAGIVIPERAIDLKGATLTDVSGNPARIENTGISANPSFKVDTAAPGVTSVVVSGKSNDAGTVNNIYRAGDEIIVTVTFNEDVTLNIDSSKPKPTLDLQVGRKSCEATYQGQGTNKRTLIFSYTLVEGDTAADGVAVKPDGLDLKSASLTDNAGNAPQKISYTAVSANPSVKVDTDAPQIVSFSATSDKLLIIGQSLLLRAKVSEALRPDATVTVKLNNGGTVTLTVDPNDATQLMGNYTVQAGQTSSNDLKVESWATTTSKDLAGNLLKVGTPLGAGANIGAAKPIAVDADKPSAPSVFRLDASSDAGSSNTDGLTNVTLPSFNLEGLKVGAKVVVTATYKGSTVTLLDFTATATTQTVATGVALGDGVYTNVAVRQSSVSGNVSDMVPLGNTKTSGSFEINTAAPSVATSLVFDDIQDTLSDEQYDTYKRQDNDAKTPGNRSRDYRTGIQQPRFDFEGGKPGETAVLFRDVNNNDVFDADDILLGRNVIGPASAVAKYKLGTIIEKQNGHWVEVAPENALPNGNYTDIKLVLQSASGTYGAASSAALNGLVVFNNIPLTPLSEVRAILPTSPDLMGKKLLFGVRDGNEGATVTFRADVIDLTGKKTLGVIVGSGLLKSKQVEIDTSALNGSYDNFMAIQSYAGKVDEPVAVTLQNSNDRLAITWDHIAPKVQVAIQPKADGTGARPGEAVELVFTFDEEVKDFAVGDIVVNGGTLIDFAGSGRTRTAKFKPNDGNVLKGDVQVSGASYTDVAGNAGAASNKLDIVFNRPGAITLSGISGSAPQVGETLSAAVSDPDGNPTGTVSYTWSVDGTTVGGNTATYKVQDADKGKKIKVTASYRDGANMQDTASSSETAQVTGPNNPPQVVFKVNGVVVDPDKNNVLRYDDTVTVEVNDKDGAPAPDSLDAVWLDSHGRPQNQITKPLTFEVTDKILKKNDQIHFLVKYTDQAGNKESWAQAELDIQSFKVRPKQQPGTISLKAYDKDNKEVVAGTELKLGYQLEATILDENDVDNSKTIEYHWIVGGEDRSAVNRSSHYLVGANDYGKDIKVQVVYVDGDNNKESPTSTTSFTVEPTPDNKPPTGKVEITGAGMLGTVLTAQAIDIKDGDGLATNPAYTYKWYSVVNKETGEKTEISAAHFQGNDSSKLVVTSDLLGKHIQVEAQFKDLAGFDNKITGTQFIFPTLPQGFTVTAPLSFTGLIDQDTRAKLLKVAPDSNLYILDVDGNGTIDQNDARTYIGNLDANASIGVTTAGGHGRATLLGKDSTWWSRFDELDKGILGTATGAKGVIGSNSASDVPAKDFWTATAADAIGNGHFVWTKDGGSKGGSSYEMPDNSYARDPNRLHYYLFEVKVNTGGVLPG